MSDDLKHECAVAMVVLRKPAVASSDFGGTKLSLMLEKQHNRGQDGAGAAVLFANPEPGETPYWIAKSASATPLTDVLGMIGRRPIVATRGEDVAHGSCLVPRDGDTKPRTTKHERIFLGHLRYATFGKNDVAFCHPFVHESSDLAHTLLLAGNFNLTNATELFNDYSRHGSFPTSKADGYLITELIAHELGRGERPARPRSRETRTRHFSRLASAISAALKNADGAWTLCGMTADGWAFATRDPHGIRPGFYYVNDQVAVVASERPAIQAAFDVTPEEVKELPPGCAMIISPDGDLSFEDLDNSNNSNTQTFLQSNNQTIKQSNNQTIPLPRPCSFERIYFSRANDADIHRERKALGAALVPQILEAAHAPIEDIFFSYIPNSARIAFHGLLEEIFKLVLSHKEHKEHKELCDLCGNSLPRFGEIAVKDAKFRTFIADAAARREFYKHVYDVTYGLVHPGLDTLVVLDDSIVRGNTMKNAILPMLDRLGPKRIVIASSAPPIRYPDCYGIDMSTLGELVAFRALVNLLGPSAESLLRESLNANTQTLKYSNTFSNPLGSLYARFTEEEHCAEIARLLTPPEMKAEVAVVYQTTESLRRCLAPSHEPRTTNNPIGDWYFTGEYPTPGGYKVLHTALRHYIEKSNERSY